MTNARRHTSHVERPRRSPVPPPIFAKRGCSPKRTARQAATRRSEEEFLPGPGSRQTRRSAAALNRRKAPAPLLAPSSRLHQASAAPGTYLQICSGRRWDPRDGNVRGLFFFLTRSLPVLSSGPFGALCSGSGAFLVMESKLHQSPLGYSPGQGHCGVAKEEGLRPSPP